MMTVMMMMEMAMDTKHNHQQQIIAAATGNWQYLTVTPMTVRINKQKEQH